MQKSVYYGIGTVVLVVIVVTGAAWLKQSADQSTTTSNYSATASPTPTKTTSSQLAEGGSMQSEDEVVGTGEEATTGKTVEVNYVGTFTNGTKFDASADHGQTFSFKLGAGQVITGWDQGVVGMKVGGKRKLTVPPDLAYGPNDYQGIPGNSTLIFEIELISVK